MLTRAQLVARYGPRVVVRRCRRWLDQHGLQGRGGELSDRSLLAATRCSSLEALVRRLRRHRRPRFFVDLDHREAFLETLGRWFPGSLEALLAQAHQVCAHRVTGFGGQVYELGETIDWHLDFASGLRWDPRTFCSAAAAPRTDGADVKVPWEVARFQHTTCLGQAYWISRDERYALEFVRQVTGWIEANPFPLGIHWSSPMECALRLVNWLVGYHFLRRSSTLSDHFLLRMVKSILQQARHVERNLEVSVDLSRGTRVAGNHYLCNVVGLLYVGILLPELRRAGWWRHFGRTQMISEMQCQVRSDGVHGEGSLAYHRFALEVFLCGAHLCLLNRLCVPREFLARLTRMVDVLKHTVRPDGSLPQIGDNDSGRWHVFAPARGHKALYLLSHTAVFEGRGLPAGDLHEESLWLFGPERCAQARSGDQGAKAVGSKGFEMGGLYVLRGGGNYALIHCPTKPALGRGAHRHNDTLSLVLTHRGKNILVDSGTYTYGGDYLARHRFRSTSAHNVVRVDGREMNPLDPSKPFVVDQRTRGQVSAWETGEYRDVFVGQYRTPAELGLPVVVRRRLVFEQRGPRWTIVDTVMGRGTLLVESFFHLAPGLRPAAITPRSFALDDLLFSWDGPGKVEVDDGWFSPAYGLRVRNKVVRFVLGGVELPTQMTVRIEAVRGRGGHTR